MNSESENLNPYAPPTAELSQYRYLPPLAVDRRMLLVAMLLSLHSPAILLIEERIHPAITCSCLVGPPLLACLTQRGKWRLMSLVICTSYTMLGTIVGSFLYWTFWR